jgi:hypothetical protein
VLDESKKEEIRSFLRNFKEIASKGRGIDVVLRRENFESLAQLGLTKKNRNEEIMTLSLADYSKGPEPDTDRPGDVWVFGKQIESKDVYIKLKIVQEKDVKIAKCISFHPAKYPLDYPYKEKNTKKGGDDQ